MKQIKKQKQPNSLTLHKRKKHADYENYQDKKGLREGLFSEQRGICCYCMGQIADEVNFIKIEHFRCQENFPELQLDYQNMLGACMGNEGQPEKFQHCDTYKGTKELTFYPPDSRYKIEDIIVYGNDGSIGSTNEELNRQIDDVLHLNIPKLKNNRKAALDGFKGTLHKFSGKIKRQTLEKWLSDWNGDSHKNNLQPYCQVIVYWLKRKLKSS